MAMGYKKRSDREVVQRVVDVCFADPTRADSDVLHAAASLAKERRSMPNQEAHFLQAARSLMLLLGRPRHYQALIRRVRCPVLLIHGERDRLVPVAAARKVAAANPEWETAFLPDVGHTPQLEAPEVVVDLATDWLQRHDLVSVRRRR
jgi:pimeloyl-ACP methyl ester carboxylesterase